jgi:hypothetical protein
VNKEVTLVAMLVVDSVGDPGVELVDMVPELGRPMDFVAHERLGM